MGQAMVEEGPQPSIAALIASECPQPPGPLAVQLGLKP
jgi:hypothetical protein